MAIKGFKDIIDRKGYKVDSEDRKVFEKEISKSNFGLGCSDMIEFILYDSSENQLPQGEDEKLVRYIHINDANIENYLVLGSSDKSEYLIGYFTKYGDGASDMTPIVSLYKLQVREIAKYLGIPENIISKPDIN